jgi:peptidoglycan/xylan/chitin deacetylase (PgdA/CDA1 family)
MYMLLSGIRSMILSGADAVGAFAHIADSRWRSRRLAILLYHGISVSDEHEWDPELYVPAGRFEERLRLLRDGGFHVLPLPEALARLDAGTLPPRSVALTFDDGSADFHSHAMPLLARYGYPATVFLTSYYVRYPAPVFGPMCSYLLWRGRERVLAGVAGLGPHELRTPRQRSAAAAALADYAVREGYSGRRKTDLLASVARNLEIDFDALLSARTLQLMTPGEVAEASRAGFDIQLHTHTHDMPHDFAGFRREVELNRSHIREITGIEPSLFCYPSGYVHRRFPLWLRELGVRAACTCRPGLASPATDPWLLPRVADSADMPARDFLACTTGLRALLPRRRHVAHSPRDARRPAFTAP